MFKATPLVALLSCAATTSALAHTFPFLASTFSLVRSGPRKALLGRL